ncbi:non-ribosomal peptide synthetase, partial [Flavobacterium sp. T12S277]|uniref:non-ribosomal peptide synthetase n=1 Tax=Flavobacterium sp. T12S277 TaxID=3402752 RepID=UPI003AE35F65
DDSHEELMGSVSYAVSLFDKVTIDRFVGHYKHLLAELISAPDNSYDNIGLLLADEYKEIVYNWNATDKDYPGDKTIYELFQEQAERTPDNIALVYDGEELSYRDLNDRSNQLARYIRSEYQKRTQRELTGDSLIALCLERSLEMIIGILGVLKAGGAYVPIDADYPQERIDYILEDTGSVLVLSQTHLMMREGLQLPEDKVVAIDLVSDFYQVEASSNLPQHSLAKNLAYVIYTSGTTGRPKGVMIEHAGVVNYINNINNFFSNDIVNFDFSTNLAFDLSITTTLCPILLGKKIFIYSGRLNDIYNYTQHLIDNEIDFIKNTPSLLINLPEKYFFDYKIKKAFIGGEKLEHFQLVQLLKYINIPIDEYGPTETTVGISYAIKNNLFDNNGIGKIYFNTKAYVLDANNFPVPIGVIGELHIGGAGLARGYLNRLDLTHERFIDNPFATQTDLLKGYNRLYKTGDLVRWLVDGNLEYLGRNDDQVKIRGYRIELGEIEYALSGIPGIVQSCVLVKERDTAGGVVKSLVGYYVLDHGEDVLDQGMILDELSRLLPDYMVPGALVVMDSFPLTINGKLDKRSLPDPD